MTAAMTRYRKPPTSLTPWQLPARAGFLQRCGGRSCPTGACSHEPLQAPSAVHEALSTPGQPLDGSTRAAMEGHFGHDFSRVRVHADARAAAAAGATESRAFTVGRDIVFGAGNWNPHSTSGQLLLAHELTHVLQQRATPWSGTVEALELTGPDHPAEHEARTVANGIGLQRAGELLPVTPARLMRAPDGTAAPDKEPQQGDPGGCTGMRLGRGKPKAADDASPGREAPQSEQPRVLGAIRRIAEVAEHPAVYPRCHEEFTRLCPGGRKDALQRAFRCAVVWRLDTSEGAGASAAVGGQQIGYTELGYHAGEEALAGYLMHELGHSCGIGGGDEHHLADVLRLYCMGAGRHEADVRLVAGPDVGPGLLLGYRGLVRSWLAGRQQLVAGVDLDFLQLVREAAEVKPGYLGGAALEFRERVPVWGAERFGGLSLYGGLGAGAARFRVRDASTHPTATLLGPGVVIDVGARAEFYFRNIDPNPDIQEGRRIGVAATAGYRLIVPLTPEAKQIHEIVFGIQVPFRSL
jgi:hypothetical protein